MACNLNETEIVEGAWCCDGESNDISYKWVTKMEDIQQIEQGIHVLEFAEKYAKRNPDMEFRLIRRITETQFHNEELKDYEPKLNKMNRYNNILPYKRTEVKLIDSEEDEEGYINASYINGVHMGIGKNKFIATQGPLPETLGHFWKMVWNESVQCIVMLCNLKEYENIQCEQYWPATTGASQTYGKIKVTFEEEIKQGSLIKRRFSVSKVKIQEEKGGVANGGISNQIRVSQEGIQDYDGDNNRVSQEGIQDYNNRVSQEGIQEDFRVAQKDTHVFNKVSQEGNKVVSEGIQEEKRIIQEGNQENIRVVWQYQWSEWRDHGVPEAAGQAVIDELVETMITEYTQNRTSVIHCSAGVGRTGTLISLVNLVLNLRHHLPKLEKAVKEGVTNYQKCDYLKGCTLSVFGVVRRLREQRWGMVHHAEQYRYLYKYIKQMIEQEMNKINAAQLLIDAN